MNGCLKGALTFLVVVVALILFLYFVVPYVMGFLAGLLGVL